MSACGVEGARKIRILIADDHFVVRMGLAALFTTERDFEIVAEAGDGVQAVELYRKHLPDVALVDLSMPRKTGIMVTREICQAFSHARVLILSVFDGDEDIFRSLDAGALGYVLKNSPAERWVPAIRAVARGERWIPPEVASRLAARKTFESLTDREIEVLQQLSKGLANKQIADVLQISEYTIKDHLKHILGKLRVCDRTEAVTAALQRGIIHL
jgi:DNA-binding NarL/FixJ family response regulator